MKKLLVCLFTIAVVFTSCGTDTPEEVEEVEEPEVVPAYIGEVIKYPWPDSEMPRFPGVTMTADGEVIDLHSVRANNWNQSLEEADEGVCDQVAVGMFDMGEGPLYMTVTVPVKPGNVIIRPLGDKINHKVHGNKIAFTITKPGKYSVEWNNVPTKPVNAVIIFANPKEDFSAIEAAATTDTVEPGIHAESRTVASGRTLYLKPGAVIRGSITMSSNSKLVGRGIIDGSKFRNWLVVGATLPIRTNGTDGVEVRGVTIFDSNGWNVELRNTTNVTIDNLKMVSARCNSDGISIQSSNNIEIKNSFLRNWDDNLVIKNYEGGAASAIESHDIHVKDTILWTDLAQSMEIGFETNKGRKAEPKIYNISFENITVFHAMHKAPISIHNGDNTEIYDIIFKNITVENYQSGWFTGWNYLIDFTNMTGAEVGGAGSWTTVPARGTIRDVLVEDVYVYPGRVPSARFQNGSAGGEISGITIKNVYQGDAKLNFSNRVHPNVGTGKVTFQ